MANFAAPYDNAGLKALMQQTSTKVHSLVYSINALWTIMSQIADDDLKAILAAGDPSLEIDAVFQQVRDWQYAMKNFADNYTGAGTVSDNSFHIAKRALL